MTIINSNADQLRELFFYKQEIFLMKKRLITMESLYTEKNIRNRLSYYERQFSNQANQIDDLMDMIRKKSNELIAPFNGRSGAVGNGGHNAAQANPLEKFMRVEQNIHRLRRSFNFFSTALLKKNDMP